MGIVEYVPFDGKQEAPRPPVNTTLAQLRDPYFKTHKASLEANTLAWRELTNDELRRHTAAGDAVAVEKGGTRRAPSQPIFATTIPTSDVGMAFAQNTAQLKCFA
jgi:hypothetical protein